MRATQAMLSNSARTSATTSGSAADIGSPEIGSAADIRDRLRPYVDAGATGIIVSLRPPFSPELMRKFAAEVMPAFR